MKIKNKLILIGLIGGLVLSMVGCSNSKNKSSANENNTGQATTEEVEEETSEEPEKTYSVKLFSGMYKVGEDLPAGEYVAINDGESIMGKYEIVKDTSGDVHSILESNSFCNFEYLKVEDGTYLKLEDCYIIPKNEANINFSEEGELTNGMFQVGVDVPPGEYKLVGDDGWYVIQSGLGDSSELINCEMFKNFTYIKLEEGQFLKLDNETTLIK